MSLFLRKGREFGELFITKSVQSVCPPEKSPPPLCAQMVRYLCAHDERHFTLSFFPSSVTREAQASSYQAGSQQHSALPTLGHDSAQVSGGFFPLFLFLQRIPRCVHSSFKRKLAAFTHPRERNVLFILPKNILSLRCY